MNYKIISGKLFINKRENGIAFMKNNLIYLGLCSKTQKNILQEV